MRHCIDAIIINQVFVEMSYKDLLDERHFCYTTIIMMFEDKLLDIMDTKAKHSTKILFMRELFAFLIIYQQKIIESKSKKKTKKKKTSFYTNTN